MLEVTLTLFIILIISVIINIVLFKRLNINKVIECEKQDYYRIVLEDREACLDILKERIEEHSQLVSFEDLANGSLCIIDDETLIFKTEYKNNENLIKSFIVGTGEYFHCKNNGVMVKPVDHLKLL